MKIPDYVLEAHFKTLLRKARLFDWIEARLNHAEFIRANGKKLIFNQKYFDDFRSYVEQELKNDPDFQWLKD